MVEVKLKLLLIFGIFQCIQAATLRCYKGTLDVYTEVPLNDTLPLLESSCIDSSRPTVFYVFGFMQTPTDPDVETILTAYLDGTEKNVIQLDWEEEASVGGLGELLGYVAYAVPNAKTVGQQLGQAIVALVQAGLNDDVHCVGHSLGGHLVAYTGKWTKEHGFVLPRITGLDPAGPVFNTLPAEDRLNPTSAAFVDVIHTNPTKYGSNLELGTVDFWVNPETIDGQTQPGCPVGIFLPFTEEDLCSHHRSIYYFSEALGTPKALPAAGAADYTSWEAGDVTGVTSNLGEETNTDAEGNFYLVTNPEPPYGKGEVGTKPDTKSRGKSSLIKKQLDKI